MSVQVLGEADTKMALDTQVQAQSGGNRIRWASLQDSGLIPEKGGERKEDGVGRASDTAQL